MSVSMNPGAMQLIRMPAAGVLLRHRLGQADEPRLAGRVVGLPLVADDPDDAGDVDDAAAAPLHHALGHGAHGEERALEVGVQHRVPVGLAQPQQDVVPGEPGVVDQDIDRAEGLLRRGDAPRPPGRRRRRRRRPRRCRRRGSRPPPRPASASRPMMATFAPAACSAVAMAWPMPRVLPVTKATFPVRSMVVMRRGTSRLRRPCRA